MTDEAVEHQATPAPAPAVRGLISKLAEVMTAVDRIPKRGHNAHFNYDYVTEADIAEAVRAELAQRHVMIIPSVKTVSFRQGEKICTLLMHYRVIDGETGEVVEFDGIGEGQDPGDKATYKALTGANKYALMKLFQIPTGDDPERDSSDATPVTNGVARRKRGYQPPTPETRQATMDTAPYKEREAAVVPPEAVGEREALLAKVIKYANALELDAQSRRDVAMTYLGTTDTKKADLSALGDLVKFLEQRMAEKGLPLAS